MGTFSDCCLPHRWASSPGTMMDMQSPLSPLSPLEAAELASPLSEDFLREVGDIQDVPVGAGEDSESSFGLAEYTYLGNGPGSEASIITGEGPGSSSPADTAGCPAPASRVLLGVVATTGCPGGARRRKSHQK